MDSKSFFAGPAPTETRAADADFLVAVIRFIKNHAITLAFFVLLGLGGGVYSIVNARPLFTASSTLLIENGRVDLFQRPSIFSDATADNSFVESQIEVIKSNTVAREVKSLLGIKSMDEISLPQQPGAVGRMMQWIASQKERFVPSSIMPESSEPQAKTPYEDPITEALAGAVTVRRVGLTFVIDISATAESPKLAAEIANAFPEAYLNVDREARLQNSQRAVTWMQERLSEMRDKIAESDQAVEAFKRDRGQVSADKGPINSQLRQLESVSTSYKTLYDSMQARYLQEVQEQSFIRNRGWLISPAGEPRKTWPRTTIVLGAAMVLGLALGLAFSVIREAISQRWAIISQYEARAGVPCIATVPVASETGLRAWMGRLAGRKKGPLIRGILDAPFGPFAEEIKRVAILIARRHPQANPGAVIGVISLAPDEGKSTIAANLAQSLRMAGHKVVLVDLDSRNPSLSRAYSPVLDAPVIDEPMLSKERVWEDPAGSLEFIPNSSFRSRDSIRDSQRRDLQAAIVADNVSMLRKFYHYVIVDLPPLGLVADAEAVAHLVDDFLLVVSVKKSEPEQVERALRRFDPTRSQVMGLVLNQIDRPDTGGDAKYYG
ncbi:MAG: hypothetical protein U1E62_01330 [Alsobacter sp.]